MSRRYLDISVLAAAAKANNCTVHLHQEADGRNVFSVGNSNIGAREFDDFDAAFKFAQHKESLTYFDAERESEICNGPSNIEYPTACDPDSLPF